MTFYERLENLRKEYGISQKELETELGFSNGSISKWKKSTPKIERLQKIANYFNVSIEYLQFGTEPQQPLLNPPEDEYFKAATQLSNDKEFCNFLISYWKLNKEDRKTLWKFIEILTKKEHD